MIPSSLLTAAFLISAGPGQVTSQPLSGELTYMVDDGSGELFVGPEDTPSTMIWVNQFNVEPGGEILTGILVAWGPLQATEAEIVVYRDPNNDGLPGDITGADLIDNCLIAPETEVTNQFIHYPMPDVPLGEVGDSFFIGVCMPLATGDQPAQLDYRDGPTSRSWITVDTGSEVFDCTDPNGASFGLLTRWELGYWLIRAVARSPVAVESTTWTHIKHLYQTN